MIYKTLDGDVLDAVCFAHYGTEHGTTERVLAVNHGLAALPCVLPAGITIVLPGLVVSDAVDDAVSLWD